MKVTFSMAGFRELERALAEELPKATARNALRRSAVKALEPVEVKAKSYAPVEDGDLREGITTKALKAKQQRELVGYATRGGVAAATGPTAVGNPLFQEEGTVNMPPNPYMRPAADEEGAATARRAAEALTEQVDKAKARIARKAARKAKR